MLIKEHGVKKRLKTTNENYSNSFKETEFLPQTQNIKSMFL